MGYHLACPLGGSSNAPRGVSALSVTATASAETGDDAAGTYVFKVVGDTVYLLFDEEGAVTDPTSSTGFPVLQADHPVCFELPAGTRFKAICASTESATLFWYRSHY